VSPALERRCLQAAVLIAGLVPVGAGAWGAIGRLIPAHGGDDSHVRYLSGLLLGIGLIFWWTVPRIEARGAVVRVLAAVVLVGGLARLAATPQTGFTPGVVLPLVMELGVTPLIALWRERVERRLSPPRREPSRPGRG
jgi:hypothetical protein